MPLLNLILGGEPEKLNIVRTAFIETKPWEKGFAEHYKTKIIPHLEDFDNRRIIALQSFGSRMRWSIPLGIILLILAYYIGQAGFKEAINIAIGIVFISFSVLYWWCNSPVKSYKSSVKAKIFPKIFEFLGTFEYSEVSRIHADLLSVSNIIPNFDEEKSEDYIKGRYDNVGLELYESELIKISTTSKGRKKRQTIFDGMFILLEMNKNFKGKTLLKKDQGMFNWVTSKFNDLENVKLEDPQFEKIFEVYSSDQIEARYILTTAFMDRILKLGEILNSTSLQASFYDNKLLLMVATKINRFETSSIFLPATFLDDTKSLLTEMNMIFQIIETLKLNQKIGI